MILPLGITRPVTHICHTPVQHFGGIIEEVPVSSPYDDREDLSGYGALKFRKVGCPCTQLANVAWCT